MDDYLKEKQERIRRSVANEIVLMEDDFDMTRSLRTSILTRIMEDVNKVTLHDKDNNLKEDADTGMRVYATALKALADVEKASATAINIKLRNRELDMANAADSKNRIAAILLSVAPSRITEEFPSESLESHLEELFDADIKLSELKTSSTCLEE
jgi:hypothetical protein